MRKMSLTNEQQSSLRRLFEDTQLTYEQLAEKLNTTYKVIWRFISNNYTKEQIKNRKSLNYRTSKLGELNPMKDRFGELHQNYIGEISDGKGYIMILKPSWYTGRKGSKHVFKHSVVICESLGITEIPQGFVVHHIDHNKTNNDLSNLMLLTNEAHIKLHHLERATTISEESRE